MYAAQNYDYILVLDFEATCQENDKSFCQEVIELPIVVLDARTFEVVGEFREHVRPVVNPILTPFCTQLTSIQQEQVAAADDFPAVFARAQAFLSRLLYGAGQAAGGEGQGELEEAGRAVGGAAGVPRALFVTCGDWDLQKMLPHQAGMSHLHVPTLWRRWCNLKVIFAEHAVAAAAAGGVEGASRQAAKEPAKQHGKQPGKQTAKQLGMAEMLNRLGLPLLGRHHCGIDDTRNIAAIARELARRGAVLRQTGEVAY